MLQALKPMHDQQRGICDIKPQNTQVRVAEDGTFLDSTLLDLGGSTIYDGAAANQCKSICL